MSESQCAVLSLCQVVQRLSFFLSLSLALSALSPRVKLSLEQGLSLFQDETGVCWMSGGLSHAAILLPGLMYHGGVGRVEGWSEGTQETSKQREAQSTPCTKHGPAITMADVIWYPKHVARVAGQFEVDPGHTCAKGDDAARPCQKERVRHNSNPFPSPLMHHFATFPLSESSLPLCGESGNCSLCKVHLTSHEEEKSGDILHQIMLLTAAQHAYDPAEQDDGYGHAYEAGSHPLEVCKEEWRRVLLGAWYKACKS